MSEQFNPDGADWIDLGLGAILGLDSEMGKIKVPQNVNTDELGNLGLTAAEEAAIVVFMKILSDGYVPPE